MKTISQVIAAWSGGDPAAASGTRRNIDIITRTHPELDLTDQSAVRAFMQDERPDVVILAAAKVGGILPTTAIPPTSSMTT